MYQEGNKWLNKPRVHRTNSVIFLLRLSKISERRSWDPRSQERWPFRLTWGKANAYQPLCAVSFLTTTRHRSLNTMSQCTIIVHTRQYGEGFEKQLLPQRGVEHLEKYWTETSILIKSGWKVIFKAQTQTMEDIARKRLESNAQKLRAFLNLINAERKTKMHGEYGPAMTKGQNFQT